VNKNRLYKTLSKWSANGYRSVTWSELVTLLKSLNFDVKPKEGTICLVSHEVLAKNAPEFSPCGAFLIDKPHRKGDPVDPGAMRKKIIPAIEMIIQTLDLEDEQHETDY
jgi:hypothetical protein